MRGKGQENRKYMLQKEEQAEDRNPPPFPNSLILKVKEERNWGEDCPKMSDWSFLLVSDISKIGYWQNIKTKILFEF